MCIFECVKEHTRFRFQFSTWNLNNSSFFRTQPFQILSAKASPFFFHFGQREREEHWYIVIQCSGFSARHLNNFTPFFHQVVTNTPFPIFIDATVVVFTPKGCVMAEEGKHDIASL